MEPCTNPDFLVIINIILNIIDIIKIIIPIILIVLGLIDFSKAVITNDESTQKKNVNKFVKRVIFAVLVFAVPWMVEVVLINVGGLFMEVNFTDCLVNVDNIDYYRELATAKKESEIQKEQTLMTEKELNQKEDYVLLKNETIVQPEDKLTSDDKSVGTGILIGQKYILTDSQLKGIARLCQQEQGTAIGAAAEASLMANQFELFGSKYGIGGDGLYNYVATSGWFSRAQEHMAKIDSLKDDVYIAVYDVLVLGKRTLPFYINEHDCIKCGSSFDINKIVFNDKEITDEQGLLDRGNYVQDKTVIYNRYNSIYTFYSFPTPTSDPFGYTEYAKKRYDSLNS